MNRGRGFQNSWWLVLLTLGMIISTSISLSLSANSSFFAMALSEVSIIVPIMIGLFMMSSEQPEGSASEALGVKTFPLRLLPLLIVLPLAMQTFASYVLLPIQTLLSIIFGSVSYDTVKESSSFLENFAVMCILAPIFEELLCRGVIMSLLRRYGVIKMLIFSSLAFALLHLNIQTMIPIFMLGLLLGTFRLTTGSLAAPIVAHSANNFFVLVLLYCPMSVQAMANVVLVVVLPILMYVYFRLCGGKWCGNTSVRSEANGFSVGLVLVLLIFLIFNAVMLAERFMSGAIFNDISSLTY